MRYSTLTTLVLSWASVSLAVRGSKRQTGPVDPGTNPDCIYFDTAFSEYDDCAYFEDFWGISHEDFVAWNPSVKDDCSGIKVGNSYCVQAPPPSTTTRATTTVPTTAPTTTTGGPAPTGPPKPSPTQDGLIDTCTVFYKAVRDETCADIVRKYGTFTLSQFIAWNPAVGAECRGLWADTYYCVGIPGTPTVPPTTSTTSTGVPKPSPTQGGLIESCVRFYKAIADDSCNAIVARYGGAFTLAQFIAWNPAVGSDCRGLWADTYYCVGLPDTPTTIRTTTTTARSTTTTTSGNGIVTPTPTQPSMVANCDRFYFVKAGDNCQQISQRHGISQAQLNIWNPSIGSGTSCAGLWANAYVCVRTIGFVPPTTSTCYTSNTMKTWGGNKQAALNSVTLFCNGDSSTDGSGGFATGQRKRGCYNAALGDNMFNFDILNSWGIGQSLSVARCNTILKEAINRCERGGTVLYESWQASASVVAGRC